MSRLKLLLISCAWIFALPALRAHAEPILLSIVVHMATEGGRDVAPPEFVETQVRRANEIFAPYGVAFELRALVRSGSAPRMESRADRSALAQHEKPGVINCFVVAALRDVDEPDRMRRGVHWHSETHPGAHFVILSAISEPDVLAHELGHYLGNPRHSDTPGNLMSYQRTDVLPFLDEAQQRRMRRTIRAYRQSGELGSSKPRAHLGSTP